MWQNFFDWYDLVNRSEQWTQACDFAYEAVRRYWDEHGRQTFDNRMRGIEAWPPVPGTVVVIPTLLSRSLSRCAKMATLRATHRTPSSGALLVRRFSMQLCW
jgi:hypothetical protein